MTEPATIKRQVSQKVHDASFLRKEHLQHLPWFERVNWLNSVIVFGVPAMAFYGLMTTSWCWQTTVWVLLYYFWTGFGITAGYHRMWSHRAYKGAYPLQVFLCLGGTGALQGSVKWWSLLHRAHHRFTDTDDDPYNAKRGFWYAHCGWLLLDSIQVDKDVDIQDLRSDKLIRWQHAHYAWFGPFMALLFPCLVAGLGWGDFRGGFYLAGFFRLLFVQHATWCVNSVAHYFGAHTYDDTNSPKDSVFTGLLTLGEGYHNFHHEFPNDFRNGYRFFDYDPTKWFILIAMQLGLAFDVVTFSMNEIERGAIDMEQKNLDERKKGIDYGVAMEGLPVWTDNELEAFMESGRRTVIIGGVIHDVTNFIASGHHPGGKRVLLERNGKDATSDFDGGVYNHTNGARNLMSHMRVALYKEE